ncbi:MAG: hypothetical protein J5U16_06900 [Candidatus Methanoperedens sp.]|nr:hypothetical protein [Candidatus Methanoperedens sp.]
MERKEKYLDGLLVSLNEDKYDRSWLDGLFRGGIEEYELNNASDIPGRSRKKMRKIFPKMTVWFYLTETGIIGRGEILSVNQGRATIGKVIEIKNPISIDEMRKKKIDPPIQIKYLRTIQCEYLEQCRIKDMNPTAANILTTPR